jgi:hypothetical protein
MIHLRVLFEKASPVQIGYDLNGHRAISINLARHKGDLRKIGCFNIEYNDLGVSGTYIGTE